MDDKLGRRSTVEIEVAHHPKRPSQGTGTIWTTAVQDVPSGSAAGVRIPSGKLKNGSTTQWRARSTVAGTSSPWSSWQEVKIAEASAIASRSSGIVAQAASIPGPSADDIKRVLPSTPVGPSDVSLAECLSESRAKTKAGYFKNRFAFCQIAKIYARHYVGGFKVGEIKGRLVYRIRPEQEKREFEVTKHVFIDSNWGTLADAPMSVGTLIADPSSVGNAGACPRLSAAGATGFYTPDEWSANTQQWQITERFGSTRRDGYHELGSCTVTQAGRLNYLGLTFHAKNDVSSTVRCDKSPAIGWHNAGGGGCVSMDAVPAFTITREDENSEGVGFPNMYDHIKRALTPGAITNPIPGGATYPDITTPKSIPGGSAGKPLSRTPYNTDKAANQGAAKETCDREFGSLPRSEKTGKSCDEFPFASTYEGAAYAKPRHNYSVQLIPTTENSQHGTVLGAWYSNNRIIARDNFWVNVD